MPKFMLCPIEGIEEHYSVEEAKAVALNMMARVPDCKGFVVYEVHEAGRLERVSPVWIEPSRAEKVRKIVGAPVNGVVDEDEIPF